STLGHQYAVDTRVGMGLSDGFCQRFKGSGPGLTAARLGPVGIHISYRAYGKCGNIGVSDGAGATGKCTAVVSIHGNSGGVDVERCPVYTRVATCIGNIYKTTARICLPLVTTYIGCGYMKLYGAAGGGDHRGGLLLNGNGRRGAALVFISTKVDNTAKYPGVASQVGGGWCRRCSTYANGGAAG